jgi:phosphoribosylformimino-5-aminoimidazole carboxamide ribotide isomerase
MKFRPCIDIHNGKVKQIVGGSLKDENNQAKENFVSEVDSTYYANLYKANNIKGGHIILLNSKDSEYFEATKSEALKALMAYKGGLQIGGGVNCDNALEYIKAGASHVIVTSYVFKDGKINYDNLNKIFNAVGKEHLVLDLSCRKKDDKYYIVTDRWQKFTDVCIDENIFYELSKYCDEFLVHAVDVEGKASGIEEEVAKILGRLENLKVTYAGGISSFADLDILKELGNGKVDFTIGSALDIFGGKMQFDSVVKYC